MIVGVQQVDFGGQHTLLVVTGDGAGPSSAPAAASTGAGSFSTHITIVMNVLSPQSWTSTHSNLWESFSVPEHVFVLLNNP